MFVRFGPQKGQTLFFPPPFLLPSPSPLSRSTDLAPSSPPHLSLCADGTAGLSTQVLSCLAFSSLAVPLNVSVIRSFFSAWGTQAVVVCGGSRLSFFFTKIQIVQQRKTAGGEYMANNYCGCDSDAGFVCPKKKQKKHHSSVVVGLRPNRKTPSFFLPHFVAQYNTTPLFCVPFRCCTVTYHNIT